MNDYPQSNLLAAASRERDTIVDFLEWLESNGMAVASVDYETWTVPRWCPVTRSHDRLCTDYLGIDMAEVERERRAMLAEAREVSRG